MPRAVDGTSVRVSSVVQEVTIGQRGRGVVLAAEGSTAARPADILVLAEHALTERGGPRLHGSRRPHPPPTGRCSQTRNCGSWCRSVVAKHSAPVLRIPVADRDSFEYGRRPFAGDKEETAHTGCVPIRAVDHTALWIERHGPDGDRLAWKSKSWLNSPRKTPSNSRMVSPFTATEMAAWMLGNSPPPSGRTQ